MAEDAHVLLARALRTLDDEEQGTVLRNLLPVAGVPGGGAGWLREAMAQRTAFTLGLASQTSPSGDRVGLLVRLPEATHVALKAWADANGYSMNVIVRGLIERFLAEQGVHDQK